MRDRDIHRFNRLFADRLGSNQYGEPLHKWVRSNELWEPAYMGKAQRVSDSGLIYFVPKYGRVPTYRNREPVWMLAQWRAPMPLDEWLARYPTLEWPSRGYYVKITALKPEYEPTLDLTETMIAGLKDDYETTTEEFIEEALAAIESDERAIDSEIEALVLDRLPAFLRKPGTCSAGTSFGGFEVQ